MSDILKKVVTLTEEKKETVSLPKSRIQLLNESISKNQTEAQELKQEEINKLADRNFQRNKGLERLRVSKNQMIGAGFDQNRFETMSKARLRKVIRREIRHFVKPLISREQKLAAIKYLTTMFKKRRSRVSAHPDALTIPSGSILNYKNRKKWRKVAYRAIRKVWQLIIFTLIILGLFSIAGYDLFRILEQFSSL